MTNNDVDVMNGGSIFQFVLLTPAAHEWVEENLSLESWQWLGTSSFAIEARYAANIADGMMNDGLEVR